MARYTPNRKFSSFRGSFNEVRMTNVATRGLNISLTKNQHGLNIGAKPRPTRKRTKKQTINRERFKQLECMWQGLTKPQQSQLFAWNFFKNRSDKKNLTPIQRFRSEGLLFNLKTFIIPFLFFKCKLKFISETPKHRIFEIIISSTKPNQHLEQPIIRPFLLWGTSRLITIEKETNIKDAVIWKQLNEYNKIVKLPNIRKSAQYIFDHEGIWTDLEYVHDPFGNVLMKNPSPGPHPSDIGGNRRAIWHSDLKLKQTYRLNVRDLSLIRLAPSPYSKPSGIGGNHFIIWHADYYINQIFQLSVFDFSILRFGSSPGAHAGGTGGDRNIIYHIDWMKLRLYQLNPRDFSIIKESASISLHPSGIGGNESIIWHCDHHLNKIYELSTTDFSIIRQATSISTLSSGIGGNPFVLYHCDLGLKEIHQLHT